MKTIVYPGTFDPITNGHIDLVERASKLFGKVVIGIASNRQKSPLFSIEERIELAVECLKHIPNVEIYGFDSLLVDFVEQCNADAIMRGLRAVSDFEYEFQMASANKRLYQSIETLFLMAAEQQHFVASRLVKEVAHYGGDVASFVPEIVANAMAKKLAD